MLVLSEVKSSYGDICVLRGVSLRVPPGSVVALLGRNGMGKTTCVHTIMGIVPAQDGTISFHGSYIQTLPSYRISRLGLALVPQGRHIFPSLTVKENLTLGARGTGYSLDKIFELFPRLAERAKHRGNELSGGEQQMLAISRALLANPDLIMMDEPSEGLAPIIVGLIGDTILQLKMAGLSILLVEQNLALALRVCDYVYVMHKGLIVHECTGEELARDERVQAEYIGVARGDRGTQREERVYPAHLGQGCG